MYRDRAAEGDEWWKPFVPFVLCTANFGCFRVAARANRRGMIRSILSGFVLSLFIGTGSAWAGSGAPGCVGDCDGDGIVTIDEILRAVSIALDTAATECEAADANADGDVTVDELVLIVGNALAGCRDVDGVAPEWLDSSVEPGASGVARNARFVLRFDGEIDPAALRGFRVTCTEAELKLVATGRDDGSVLLDPAGLLPADSHCVISWSGPAGQESLGFRTEANESVASIVYDRVVARSVHPYPDDFFLAADPSLPNGVRLAIPPPIAPSDVVSIYRVLTRETPKYDGFSPIGHFVVEIEGGAPSPATFPLTPAASLVPEANAGLFDLTQGSPTYGRRIPFRADIRDDLSTRGARSHSILVFPSIPLEPGGRYGFVVTNRVETIDGWPLAPSSFFARAIARPVVGEPDAVTRVRSLAHDVIDVVAEREPLHPEDVAVAVRISVRSTDDIPNDLMAIKRQVTAAPPPQFTIDSVGPDSHPDVAAVVRGTWKAPEWRNDIHFVRDANGEPVQQGTNDVEFILALPAAANEGLAPITMYQHGNPGSAQREVASSARSYLAEAGFAVIGFTDNLNRELSPGLVDQEEAITAQVVAIFFGLLRVQRIPDFWVQLNGEQLAFLRLISALGELDVLPLGAPDGIPDLDVNAPLSYVGISQGANYAPGLLAYAPEIKAAASMVGGARLTEVLLHQQAETFITQLGMVFPNMTPADIWAGLSLFQAIYDNQDQHNHARFLYRQPIEVLGTTRKASLLVVEGLNDSLVPNHATESLAWALGPIPHLAPVQRVVPFLDVVEGPVVANIDAETTAAFFQYVPVGIDGIDPTPGCTVLSDRSAREGHYCAQGAEESLRQRREFFLSALEEGPPVIINPFD